MNAEKCLLKPQISEPGELKLERTMTTNSFKQNGETENREQSTVKEVVQFFQHWRIQEH
jgi:hypothetical protein